MSRTIGDIIREQVKNSPLSNKEITDRLNRSENILYTLYKKTSIDTDTLLSLSEIFNFDFFAFFYNDPILKKFITKDIELLIKDRDELQIELSRKNDIISDLQTSNVTKTEIISDLKDQISSLNLKNIKK